MSNQPAQAVPLKRRSRGGTLPFWTRSKAEEELDMCKRWTRVLFALMILLFGMASGGAWGGNRRSA